MYLLEEIKLYIYHPPSSWNMEDRGWRDLKILTQSKDHSFFNFEWSFDCVKLF